MLVAFNVVSLNVGGGEVMLARVCREMIKRGHDVTVTAILKPNVDSISDELTNFGARVDFLYNGNMWDAVIKFLRHLIAIRNDRPDVIQGWMYHGNFLVSILYFLNITSAPTFWSLHNFNFSKLKFATKILVKISSFFSPIPFCVYSCSKAAIPVHLNCGFFSQNMAYLPNGIDITVAKTPDDLRSKLGLDAKAIIVGWVGRDHPDKNFDYYISAVRRIIKVRSDIHFVCIGSGITFDSLGSRAAVSDSDIASGCIHLLGPLPNAASFMQEFDILVMSSATEAFPLVLIEAMSCGVSAVVTNVGDCPDIVSGLGEIAPVDNEEALAQSIIHQLSKAKIDRTLPKRCRERVSSRFTLRIMVDRILSDYSRASSIHEGIVV